MVNNLDAQQLYGRWVVHTMNVGTPTPEESYQLSFYENNIQESPLGYYPALSSQRYHFMSDGGYSQNFDVNFYAVSHYIFYGTNYSSSTQFGYSNTELQPEFQIINKPGSENLYYAFFTQEEIQAIMLYYMEITYNTITGIVTTGTPVVLRGGIYEGYVGFAITEEDNNSDRYLYASTINTEPVAGSAGLRKWKISSSGITYEGEIITDLEPNLAEEDFNAKIRNYQGLSEYASGNTFSQNSETEGHFINLGTEVRITDITGKKVTAFDINRKQGQQVWDTRTVKPGVYIYTLTSLGSSVSGKLVIK